MMDAGVPLKSPCAGIAMGLVVGDNNKYSILTDIAGAEDHYGDMDFQSCRHPFRITALQMDIKVTGIGIPMMREALAQAKKARLEILDTMDATLSEPRAAISPPTRRASSSSASRPTRSATSSVRAARKSSPSSNRLASRLTSTKTAPFTSSPPSGSGGDAALQMVRDVTASAEMGKTYLGKSRYRLAEFGAFVELFPRHRRLAPHQRKR